MVIRSEPVVALPGVADAEARLLDDVGDALARRAAAAAPLARPLRIVVPSTSLREHVASALVRRHGPAILGVLVQTHRALALDVLQRAGDVPPVGDPLLALFVRRHARDEPDLAELLEDLRDGWSLVEASVRDLIDAGFECVHEEAVDELLAEHELPGQARRARALARVASRSLESLDAAGIGHGASALLRARALLEQQGPDLLPTASLWIYGFADATGIATDWLETLMQLFDARAIVSQPPDPAAPEHLESSYSAALIARLGGTSPPSRLASASADPRASSDSPTGLDDRGLDDGGPAEGPPEIALLCAPGTRTEARGVARRIRSLLDRGARPEAVGVVARQLEPYGAALDAEFGALGVPFSAPGLGASGTAELRRLSALGRLLAGGARASVDTWLDADSRTPAGEADLRVGLHLLGAARLDDVAHLDLDAILAGRDFVRLPVRRGSSDEAAALPEDAGAPAAASASRPDAPRSRSNVLHRTTLERARTRARGVLRLLATAPDHVPMGEHVVALQRLLRRGLGWEARDPALLRAASIAAEMRAESPVDLALRRDEVQWLLGRALRDATGPPLGGAGAGVQVLSIMEARGRSFEHLFVLGCNRDALPRTVQEDPLLPDGLRVRVRQLLPDLQLKSRGRAEERHLFADLLTASPRVCLAWQFVNDDGREYAVSPFIVRLRLARPDLVPSDEAPVSAPPPAVRAEPGTPAPAREHALTAALYGERPLRDAAWTEAISDVVDQVGGTGEPGDAPGALCAVRAAVLEELDPAAVLRDAAAPAVLGPYDGFVGPAVHDADEPLATAFVTTLERTARCPWQTFLTRELRLEPVADALDALPAIDARVRGMLVHAVLDRIVATRGGALAAAEVGSPRELDEALQAPASEITWPGEDEVERLLFAEATRILAAEGIASGPRQRGYARALARRSRAELEIARSVDWPEGTAAGVVGAELVGSAPIVDGHGRVRPIGFRADRVDAHGARIRLTDYKTGKPPSDAATERTRRNKLSEAMARGEHLQAGAYAAWAMARGHPGAGRFLYLKPGLDPALRELAVSEADPDLVAAFEQAARAVLDASDAGAMFPRLFDGKDAAEPRMCGYCEVSAACLRGEPGHAARLQRWAVAAAGAASSDLDHAKTTPEGALLGLLDLGRERPDRESSP